MSDKQPHFMINEHLTEKSVLRVTGLDRFKARTLLRFDSKLKRDFLLDVGSGSGKFLLHNSNRYQRAVGIEVSPESLAFSRQMLKLEIIEDIRDVREVISVVTAWHSLEHIPQEKLELLLETLSKKVEVGGIIIVSVPNAQSLQYRWFKRGYAYYDVPNHLHQFTPTSLESLMRRFDFQLVDSISSGPYNSFGYIQGLLNIVTNTHNYLYRRLKRRNIDRSVTLDCLNALLLIVCLPLGLLLSLVDLINIENQGSLTKCFEKK
jgi:SAM-dependent methyltransferase